MPTPGGVPVAMTSPGSRVNDAEHQLIRWLTGKYMSAVEADWVGEPLMMHWILRPFGSGISSAVTSTGPIGQNVSSDLARTHWPSAACRSRAETSLHAV